MVVLEFIDNTEPAEVRELMFAAHDYILSLLPQGGHSKIKWRIPFYLVKKSICYINPHKDHFTIGFPRGYLMTNEAGNLLGEKEKLKQVRYIKVYDLAFLYSEEIALLLQESLLLDEQNAKGGW